MSFVKQAGLKFSELNNFFIVHATRVSGHYVASFLVNMPRGTKFVRGPSLHPWRMPLNTPLKVYHDPNLPTYSAAKSLFDEKTTQRN